MAVQIQLRRGSTTDWNAAPNVVLAAGEMAVNLTTKQFKIGDGVTQFSALLYQEFPANGVSTNAYTAKGSILSASASGVPVNVTVGANNALLVADSTANAGVKWASTLAGITLTSPSLTTPTMSDPTITGTATCTGATLASPTITGGSLTTTTVTGGTILNTSVTGTKEPFSVSATAATGTVLVDVKTTTNYYYTSNASANWTFNFRGDGSTPMNTFMAVGDSVTVVFLVTNGATARYPTVHQVDGSAVTVKWQGGVPITGGYVNSIDSYVYTIVKTANATFTVFGSQTKFA
jgi:hypothetical protein